MYDLARDMLDAMRATPAVYEALLHDCTQEQARTTRDVEDGWSILGVICHMRDAEERALERMRAMRDADEPRLAAYDQEGWAVERRYDDDDLRRALAAFLGYRKQHIDELAALRPDDWERAGQHEEQGRITIHAHTLHITAHDFMHAAQIARQLGRSGA